MRSLIPVFAAAILAGSAAPALAEVEPSVVVSYSDLNLATAEGRQALESRIAVAVDTVCARPHPTSLQQSRISAECRKRSAADAQRQMRRVIGASENVQVASAD